MNDLFQDVGFGLRNLARRPGFAAVAVATFALGVGASTAMFSVVNAVLLRPLPFPEPERIVRIEELHETGGASNLTGATFATLHERSRSFARTAVFRSFPFNLSAEHAPAEAVTVARVTADFFGALGIRPLTGRLFAHDEYGDDAAPVALVSQRVWQTWAAGDPGLVGRSVRLDGRDTLVVGVLPDALGFPEGTDVWLPMSRSRALPGNRRSHLFTTVARLRPGVSLEQARAELGALVRQLRDETGAEDDVRELTATRLHERLTASARPALLALLAAVGLLLVVACVNLAHLLLARGLGRSREFAVRVALGAGRGRLARQLVAESLALALVTVGPSVIAAVAATRALLPLLPATMPLPEGVPLDSRVLGFALATSLVSALAFGLAPSLVAARADLRAALSDGSGGAVGPRRGRLRGSLIAAEVALVVVLVGVSGLLLRSFVRLRSVPLGFRTDGVLSLCVSPGGEAYDSPARVVGFADRVAARLRALPGVEQVAASSALPTRPLPSTSFGLEDAAESATEPSADVVAVGADYFPLMGIPRLSGRVPDARDGLGAPVVVALSRTAAERFWPGLDPIGRRLRLLHWDDPLEATVVGVVEDVRQRGPEEAVAPAVYYSLAQFSDRVLGVHFLVRTSGDPSRLALAAQQVVRDVDPDQAPTGVATLDETLAGATAQRRFDALLVLLFAGAALALVVVGIQGVVACVVGERTREIGVRVALGASRADVTARMAAHALRPAAVGVGLGLAGAVAAGRAASGLLFGVSGTDPATLAVTAGAMLMAAVGAAWLPARRAASVDPVVALRSE